jgi:hypothetical protein
MKIKFLIAFCLLINVCFAAPKLQEKRATTTVNVTETKEIYQMVAVYNETDNRKIRNYMDDCLGKRNDFSFQNVNADAEMTLNDKTTFYIKTGMGKLTLKFDKRKNSAEFYSRFKKMCEGIRSIIENSK